MNALHMFDLFKKKILPGRVSYICAGNSYKAASRYNHKTRPWFWAPF